MSEIKDDLEELKKVFKATSDKELSEIIGISYAAIDAWKRRKKIPEKYNKYIHNVYAKNISGNGNYIGNKNLIINDNVPKNKQEDLEVMNYYKRLSPKRQEYYYHQIKADVLKEELENKHNISDDK